MHFGREPKFQFRCPDGSLAFLWEDAICKNKMCTKQVACFRSLSLCNLQISPKCLLGLNDLAGYHCGGFFALQIYFWFKWELDWVTTGEKKFCLFCLTKSLKQNDVVAQGKERLVGAGTQVVGWLLVFPEEGRVSGCWARGQEVAGSTSSRVLPRILVTTSPPGTADWKTRNEEEYKWMFTNTVTWSNIFTSPWVNANSPGMFLSVKIFISDYHQQSLVASGVFCLFCCCSCFTKHNCLLWTG